MIDTQSAGETLLRAWLGLSAVIWNRDLVSGMTYNEAVVCNLLCYQMDSDPLHPLTATDLCQRTRVQKSQMNQILSSLEDRGYLLRIRNKSDRRQVHLSLTQLGQEAYRASHQKAAALLSAVVERLGTETTETLTNNLKLANATVQELLSTQRQKGTV